MATKSQNFFERNKYNKAHDNLSQDLPIELMNKSMKYLIANCKVYVFWYCQIMPNYVSFIEF